MTQDEVEKLLGSQPHPADKDQAEIEAALAAQPQYQHGTPDTGYETRLDAKEERDFQRWKQRYAPRDSGADYDLRGAFKAGFKPDKENGHWPDVFKKPNHETFSNESVYAQFAPEKAGSWDGDTYLPPTPPRQPVRTVPPKDPAALQRKIDASQSPMPGGLADMGRAVSDSWLDLNQNVKRNALFGVPGRAWNSLTGAMGIQSPPAPPIPEAGPTRRPEDRLPSPELLAQVPTMAVDMATVGGPFSRVGSQIAQAPASLARAFGAKEAQLAVRPGLQTAANAAGTGLAYGATGAALEGQPIVEGALHGAAANLALSAVPGVASKIEDVASKLATRQAMQPIRETAKKLQGKALSQFARGGGKVEGAKEMEDFVDREGLAPLLRDRPRMEANVAAKQHEVWQKELQPIYDHALAAEPGASIPLAAVESNLKRLVSSAQKGTGHGEIVQKYIDLLKNRAEAAGFGDRFPLQNLLENAREFQNKGWGGVVNFDSPTEQKELARVVGGALRSMVNDEIGAIYRRNPQHAYTLATGQQWTPLGATNRGTPETPKMTSFENYPNRWASRYENLQDYVEDVPRRLAEGNQRYSDYAKLVPVLKDAAERFAEKKPLLTKMLKHGGATTAGTLAGYFLGGHAGAVAGAGLVEGATAGYPLGIRGAQSLASQLSGPTVNPGILLPEQLRLQPPEDTRR